MKQNKLPQRNPSPFIKWAGGKSRLIAQYEPYFPEKAGRYFEPFLGGGAVFFSIKPKNAVLSDYNKELINCYTQVRDNPDRLMEFLEEHKKFHTEQGKDYYYRMRSLDYNSLSDIENAARTIYLNKTCYNGLYRLNSKGGFNVPMGSYKNPGIYDPENIKAASEALKNTQLVVRDFREVINYVSSGDFVYFDPPYHPLSATANFTGYTELSFSEKDQRDLADLFRQLDEAGCFLMLSNSDTPLIREIYSSYNIIEVKANRFINSNPERRKPINELLILNTTKPSDPARNKAARKNSPRKKLP